MNRLYLQMKCGFIRRNAFFPVIFLTFVIMNSFINPKTFSTMNTKKVIFGILAVVMLATTALSTITIPDQEIGVKKSNIDITKR